MGGIAGLVGDDWPLFESTVLMRLRALDSLNRGPFGSYAHERSSRVGRRESPRFGEPSGEANLAEYVADLD